MGGSGGSSGGAQTITATSSNALSVVQNGTTNPAFNVDTSAASAATGLDVIANAAGSGVTLQSTSSAASEAITVAPKGSANALFGSSTAGISTLEGSTVRLNIGASNYLQMLGGNISFTPTPTTSASARFSLTGSADTNLVAGGNATEALFNLSQTRNHATGAISLQEDYLIEPTTHSFTGASTITNAAGFAVSGPSNAGTNATITTSSAIYVPTSTLSSNVGTGIGLNVSATTGATNNYAANFNGDITFTGNAPVVTSCGSGSLASGSTDHKGQITGISAATACTITFSQALAPAPACTFSASTAIAVGISSISTSAVTSSMTSLTGTLYYICF